MSMQDNLDMLDKNFKYILKELGYGEREWEKYFLFKEDVPFSEGRLLRASFVYWQTRLVGYRKNNNVNVKYIDIHLKSNDVMDNLEAILPHMQYYGTVPDITK